ncbi:Uma2 family endonuclease [Sinosporangium siamense]|nr:Uma2 family endonuclease [Sinosporangium siamense]
MSKVLERAGAAHMGTNRDIHAGHDDLHARYRQTCELWSDRRVEIIDGRIVVRELPTFNHATIVYRLLLQLIPFLTEQDWVAAFDLKVFLGLHEDRYRPDITITRSSPQMWDAEHVHSDDTLLVVEVVSPSSAKDDHEIKARNYAKGHVPLYLVIDPFEQVARLLSHPTESGYEQETTEALGKPLELPSPWEVTLDTAKLTAS